MIFSLGRGIISQPILNHNGESSVDSEILTNRKLAQEKSVEGDEQIPQTEHDNSSKFNLGGVINHHLADAPLWHLEYHGLDISITKRVVMMWIASFFLILFLVPIGIKIRLSPYKRPSRFGAFIEVLVAFIRDNVGRAMMGGHSSSYEPFLLTLFFFIVVCNLLGLFPPMGEIFQIIGELTGLVHQPKGAHHSIPFLVKLWPGITATGDIGVTAGLAALVFLVILSSGFIYQGLAYIKNIVPSGVPLFLAPLLWVIELAGLIIKPVALSIRLLANMTAGHIIILILMSFIFQFKSYLLAPVSVGASAAIYFLEIFVAFLQAYIFTFLAGLFISEAQHRH